MLLEHMSTLAPFGLECLSTLHTAISLRSMRHHAFRMCIGQRNKMAMIIQTVQNALVSRLDHPFIVSLQNCMLDSSFDESLPIWSVMDPQIPPGCKTLVRRLQCRAVSQLLPHPMKIVLDQLTPLCIGVENIPCHNILACM